MQNKGTSGMDNQLVVANNDNTTEIVATETKAYRKARENLIKAESAVDLLQTMVKKKLATNKTNGLIKKHHENLKNTKVKNFSIREQVDTRII